MININLHSTDHSENFIYLLIAIKLHVSLANIYIIYTCDGTYLLLIILER